MTVNSLPSQAWAAPPLPGSPDPAVSGMQRDLPHGKTPGSGEPGYGRTPGSGEPGYGRTPGSGEPGYGKTPGLGEPGYGRTPGSGRGGTRSTLGSMLRIFAVAFLLTASHLSAGVVYEQTFDTDNGGYTTSGATSWAWDEITTGPGAAHSPAKAWATNPSGDYANSENGYLASPEIDLSAHTGQALILSWWQHLITDPDDDDLASVEVTDNGGASWTPVYGEVRGEVSPAWEQISVALADGHATANFRVRFRFRSDLSDTAAGFTIDDITVRAVSVLDVYSENFNDGPGAFTTSGTTSWEHGQPSSQSASGPDSAHSGANAWGTSIDGLYSAHENGFLISPAIDASPTNGTPPSPLILSWWQFVRTEENADFAHVAVSADNGAWTTVYGPVSGDVSSAWSRRSVVLDAGYAVANLRVRFGLSSDSSLNQYGFYVDDVELVRILGDTPTVSDVPQAGTEDTAVTFGAGDFTAAFSDPQNQGLATITVTSLPAHGSLRLAQTPVTAQQQIGVAQTATLVYQPGGDYHGADSFGWTGSNGVVAAANTAEVVLTIAPENDAPSAVSLSATEVVADVAGADVGAILVTDADDTQHTFVIDDARFEAVAGRLKLKPAVSLDAAAEPTVTVQITASDSGPPALSVSDTFALSVRPRNNVPIVTTFSVRDPQQTTPGYTDQAVIDVTLTGQIQDGTVTGWLVTQTPAAPDPADPAWLPAAPTSYTISGQPGQVTLYAWLRGDEDTVSPLTATSTAAIVYEPPVLFTLYATHAEPALLRFGTWSQGTDGVDANLDVAVGTRQRNGNATIYLLAPDGPPGSQLQTDVRADSATIRWRLVVEPTPGQNPVELTWDVGTAMPGRHLYLQELRNEIPIGAPIDLKTEVLATVDHSAVFEVAYAEPEQAAVQYELGWNLIGMPLMSVQNAEQVLPDDVRVSPAWFWQDAAYQALAPGQPLNAERGYWVRFSVSDQSPAVTGIAADGTMQLAPGWNLVSPVRQRNLAEFAGVIVAAWAWDPAAEAYTPVPNDILQPGRAYWVYVAGDAPVVVQ